MAQIMIQLQNISKQFGTTPALRAVNLSVEQGESVVIVGANGAGKTTLFNIVLGLVSPDEGVCTVLGKRSTGYTSTMRQRIAFVADHASPVPWASALDIAKLYAHLYTGWNQACFDELTSAWNLDSTKRLNTLSKGQKRLAEIALVAASQPDIVVLDEPFNGLDAVMRIQIQRLLRRMQKERGATILHATHILAEVRTLADRMVTLRAGEIVFDTSLDDRSLDPVEIFHDLYKHEISAADVTKA
jgi:ABC-2 type transport system ATP-binding protein